VEIAKTGLGSSAALTTSLVSSLLQWFEVTRVGLRPDLEDRRVVHNLAQLVHANAQGKIGSGFDVAAAVYGMTLSIVVAKINNSKSPCVPFPYF